MGSDVFATIVLMAKQDLEDSLKTLYSTFFGYPFPSSLDASPLRDAEKILTALKSALCERSMERHSVHIVRLAAMADCTADSRRELFLLCVGL
ncbi:UNVERIFIED_ORG: hypothetical protein GGI63_002470 [Rhizobium esperanzae]|nr:hypothetical protein AMC89_CH02905 [Rhizobium phaseoli]ANL98673.1 hypothetical protein AMC79_CH02896 [Rhizobium phaseoli]